MLLFVLGLSLGSGLLTAITGLNKEAKSRYQTSSALIEQPISHLIKPLEGHHFIEGNIWLQLRAAGIKSAQPVLRGRLYTEEGRSIAIQGVNTLQWLKTAQSPQPAILPKLSLQQSFTGQLLIDKKFTERLYDKDNKPIPLKLKDNITSPQITLVNDIGLWGITDLALADYLLDAKGQLSFIELSNPTDQDINIVNKLIKNKATLHDTEQQDFDVLSEAFFFNLTALAMLGYVVAAFLSFNAVKLTIHARAKLLQQMHLLGCSKNGINVAITSELIVLSLLTAVLGTSLGFVIANALVLDVNQTLVGLFQLDKTLTIEWQWSNLFVGFSLNVLALAIILLSQNKFDKTRWHSLYALMLFTTLTALFNLALFAATDFQALLLCFAILVLFILVVPKLLQLLIAMRWPITGALNQWAVADSKQHLNEIQIAIIAILIALGSSIGMQIMVKSFNKSLNAHLEKQLSADIYLRTNEIEPSFRSKLELSELTQRIGIYQYSNGKLNNLPATLASFDNSYLYYQHIQLTSGNNPTSDHFNQNGCLANEQSAIKFGMQLGSSVKFVQNSNTFDCRISGFYYDYGNPQISLLTLESRHNKSPLITRYYGYSITLSDKTNVTDFSEILINEFNQDSTQIFANKKFKKYANKLFQDTFMVTKALNGFILAIALLSLCTSLLSISNQQLKQLAILRQLG